MILNWLIVVYAKIHGNASGVAVVVNRNISVTVNSVTEIMTVTAQSVVDLANARYAFQKMKSRNLWFYRPLVSGN